MTDLLERLRTAVADRYQGGRVESDSDLIPLHGDPRFTALLEQA
jgi:hypothetical protein